MKFATKIHGKEFFVIGQWSIRSSKKGGNTTSRRERSLRRNDEESIYARSLRSEPRSYDYVPEWGWTTEGEQYVAAILTQYNLSGSNRDGSFTVDDSKLFLSPYKILPIAQENKYLRKFSYFTIELYVVCSY